MQPGTLELPSMPELAKLDPYEREMLFARLKQIKARRVRRHVEQSVSLPDIADWIEANCYDAQKVSNPEKPVGPKIRLDNFQKRILRKCFTLDPRTGRFPYRIVVYSAPKKSGKSSIGAFVGAWFAANVESPNAVYVLANDREQSSGRVFSFARPTLFGLNAKKDGKYKIDLPNGSYIQASTSEPEKEAGASYGLTIWDELWGYKSERAKLLWDELQPVGTRVNSMRLVVTYAGFEDSSDLLWQLYTKIFTDSTETELHPGARPVEELADITTTDSKGNVIPCCYENKEAGIFYFNDHEQRATWQQGEHGEAIRRENEATTASPENVYRLTYNRWQKTESRFLDSETIIPSFRRANNPGLPVSKPMVFGIDAGIKSDHCGIVGTYAEWEKGLIRQPDGSEKMDWQARYVSAYAKDVDPADKVKYPHGIDLDVEIGDEIARLYRAGLVLRREPLESEKKLVQQLGLTPVEVWYDETQMHQVMLNVRRKYKLLMAKFDQARPRLLSDSFLRKVYQEFRIDNAIVPELQSHLDAAKAELQTSSRNEGLIRIVKGTGDNAKKIDLAVAQSMSVYKCSLRPMTAVASGIAQGKAKGWAK